MRYLRCVLGVIAFLFISVSFAEESNPFTSLNWQIGPTKARIGDQASLDIPNRYVFLGAEDTKKFMELNQNLPNGRQYIFAPDDLHWFAVFQFNPIGYVKDDETINAEALLNTMKENTEAGNIERKKRGWRTMSIEGWQYPPHYDNQSKRLEWAYLAKDNNDNKPIINYNTRLLGRTGVMEVILVAEPAILDPSVESLKTALNDYDFALGEKYAEFREGDHVAEYGLAALVAGGAAAVAAKKGFFTVILGFLAAAWKFVAIAVFGFLAWLKSLFSKNDK